MDQVPWSLFHDSILTKIDLSNWWREVRLQFEVRHGDKWRTAELVFSCVLMFAYEHAYLGEGDGRVQVFDVVNVRDSRELHTWKKRMADLAADGISSDQYSDVFHVSIPGARFEGVALLPREAGMEIVCRRIGFRLLPPT